MASGRLSRTVRCFQASDGLFSHATCPDMPSEGRTNTLRGGQRNDNLREEKKWVKITKRLQSEASEKAKREDEKKIVGQGQGW